MQKMAERERGGNIAILYIENSILNNKKQALSIYTNVILCKKKLAKIFAPRMSQKPLF